MICCSHNPCTHLSASPIISFFEELPKVPFPILSTVTTAGLPQQSPLAGLELSLLTIPHISVLFNYSTTYNRSPFLSLKPSPWPVYLIQPAFTPSISCPIYLLLHSSGPSISFTTRTHTHTHTHPSRSMLTALPWVSLYSFSLHSTTSFQSQRLLSYPQFPSSLGSLLHLQTLSGQGHVLRFIYSPTMLSTIMHQTYDSLIHILL